MTMSDAGPESPHIYSMGVDTELASRLQSSLEEMPLHGGKSHVFEPVCVSPQELFNDAQAPPIRDGDQKLAMGELK